MRLVWLLAGISSNHAGDYGAAPGAVIMICQDASGLVSGRHLAHRVGGVLFFRGGLRPLPRPSSPPPPGGGAAYAPSSLCLLALLGGPFFHWKI